MPSFKEFSNKPARARSLAAIRAACESTSLTVRGVFDSQGVIVGGGGVGVRGLILSLFNIAYKFNKTSLALLKLKKIFFFLII